MLSDPGELRPLQALVVGPPGRKLNFRSAFEDSPVREKTEPRFQASCQYLASPGSCSVESTLVQDLTQRARGLIEFLDERVLAV